MLQEQIDSRRVVLLECAKQGYLAVSILMVHVRAGRDEDSCEIDFECLACHGMRKSGQAGDVLFVHRNTAGGEVFQSVEMSEASRGA